MSNILQIHDTFSFSARYAHMLNTIPNYTIEAVHWKKLIKSYLNDVGLNVIKRLALLLAYGQTLPQKSAEETHSGASPTREETIFTSRSSSPLAKARNVSSIVSGSRSPLMNKAISQRKGPIHEALQALTEKCLKQKLYDDAKFCALLLNDQILSRDLAKKAIKGQLAALSNEENKIFKNDSIKDK